MKSRKRHIASLKMITMFSFLLSPLHGFGQTQNPDISVITDFRIFSHNDQTLPAEKGGLNLNLQEIEAAVQGYLNPYARADVFFAKHGTAGELEIEEASATFLRGLPWGINIKAGKYLVDFGKLNTLHPHTYYFIERPLIHQLYFGEDGLNDTGVNMSVLLPTGDLYTQASFNVLKGDFVTGHRHEEGVATEQGSNLEVGKQPLAYSGRLAAHLEVSEYANLELGMSGASAVYDPQEDLRFLLLGLDYKYKWRPSRYTSLILQGEALLNRRKIFAGGDEKAGEKQSITTVGFFNYVNLQFWQRWNVGFAGEWTQAPESKNEKYWSLAVFGGFSPMEETSVIRLLLKRQERPHETPFNAAMAQVVFSLGPHKPHAF